MAKTAIWEGQFLSQLSFPVSLSPVPLPPASSDDSIEKLILGPRNQVPKASPKLIRPIPIIPVPPSSKMSQ
ncbi:hypothetical protein Tsubulata_048082 [Turnera subulata]|uniref:Uncharacterized protein n=1 Tax=Turnera subulata TaxID=218843 RepID=A0A9Q0J4C1_9ROSI|nr:hypothetical protein Tsubulata_048082 [Turnera subulata]